MCNDLAEAMKALEGKKIGSSKSPFDIEELVDAVLAESSYFGATRSEHAQNRQEKFSDLSRICVKADQWGIRWPLACQ